VRQNAPILPVVQGSTRFDFNWDNFTWQRLQHYGLCAIEDTDSSQSGYIIIPPIVAKFILENYFEGIDKRLLASDAILSTWQRVYEQLKMVVSNWQDWEKFCASYHLIQAQLFALHLSDGSLPKGDLFISLLEFFPTTLCALHLDQVELNLTSALNLEYVEARHRWPEVTNKKGGQTSAEDGNYVALHASGASCDWFSSHGITCEPSV